MAEDIAFKNSPISNFEGLVALTLTLDRVIMHTGMHHSSTTTYMLNFIKIKETFVDGWTYTRTNGYFRLTLLGLLCRRVDLTIYHLQFSAIK